MKPPERTPIVTEPEGKAIDGDREKWPALARGRLLLGHAVQCAKTEDEIAAGDANHFAIGEEAGESVQSDAIVRIVERRHEHNFVGNVKIRVTRGKPETFEMDWRGHRKCLHAKRPAVLIFHRF